MEHIRPFLRGVLVRISLALPFIWCFSNLPWQIGSCCDCSAGPLFHLAHYLMVASTRGTCQGESSHTPFPFLLLPQSPMHPSGISKTPASSHNIWSLLQGLIFQNYLSHLSPKVSFKNSHLLSGFGCSEVFISSYLLFVSCAESSLNHHKKCVIDIDVCISKLENWNLKIDVKEHNQSYRVVFWTLIQICLAPKPCSLPRHVYISRF